MFDNLADIQQSYSVAFADFVREHELAGRRIVKMQTGDPDFATHPGVVEAAHGALLKGETKYCDSRGLPALRDALVKKLAVENGIRVAGRNNVLVTHGAVHAIGMAIRAVLNRGDECIICEPYWRAYQSNVILAGGVPVIVPTRRETGFQLEADRVLERITPRTKAIIINTPNNPSGAVYHRAELRRLAAGASERGVYVISDEVYESLVFGAAHHFSVASDPAAFDRTISVFSFSKTHAMTGWRVGYVAATAPFIDEMLKLSQFSVTSLSPFNQLAALAALTRADARDYAGTMRAEYGKRRERIVAAIQGTWLEQAVTVPSGAFYALIDTSRFKLPSLQLAQRLVDSASVAFTPGIAFGDAMDGYLRMCFATSNDNIDRAVAALIHFEKETSREN